MLIQHGIWLRIDIEQMKKDKYLLKRIIEKMPTYTGN